MENRSLHKSSFGLEQHCLQEVKTAHWNLGPARLTEEALARGEGQLAANGSLVVRTGKYTGRSPGDRFIVSDDSTEDTIDWGPVNQKISPKYFDRLLAKIQAYLKGREVFVQDCFGGAAPDYALRFVRSTNSPGTAYSLASFSSGRRLGRRWNTFPS